MEIFNYSMVLIDIMIVMPLEAGLTNRFKPAATFVEDVLVRAHCWCTCTLFWVHAPHILGAHADYLGVYKVGP